MKISKLGEFLAENHLKLKNYQILSRNKRYRQGEIDLVARYYNCLVFVEVKTRATSSFGYPETAFNEIKSQRLELAINRFLEEFQYHGNWRVDLIAIEIKDKKAYLRHYQGVSLD